MSFFKAIAVVAMLGLVSACATLPPPSLSVSELQRFKVVGVVVQGVEGIRSWPAEEERFLRSVPVDADTQTRIQTSAAASYPPLRDFMQRSLDDFFQNQARAQLGTVFEGQRPVVLRVTIKSFDVPSVARRVFIDSHARTALNIDLLDPRSQTVIVHYEGPLRARQLIGGLATGLDVAINKDDIGRAMLIEYMTGYRQWLLER
jgi:hypothetical protein